MVFLGRNIFKFNKLAFLITSRSFSSNKILCSKKKCQQCIKCTLIPGDGVGPDLVNAVKCIFEAGDVPIEFECKFLSEVNFDQSEPLEEITKSIKKNRICLKGILTTPDKSLTGEAMTLNMRMRLALDLYANVVHVQSIPGIKCRHKNIDLAVVREQTEGEYSALEHESVKGVVECLKIITAVKSKKIAKFAFDYAIRNKRKKVTAVHKANIMKIGDGEFLKACDEVSLLYPTIKYDKMIVDNTTMQLVSNPNQFDVMVTPNLYGHIIANLAAGLAGGAGVVPGASYSTHCCVFEPGARHAFAIATGKNIANPTAMILCSAKLLAHCNLHPYSKMIKNAVKKICKEGKHLTQDVGGKATTEEFTNAVIDALEPV